MTDRQLQEYVQNALDWEPSVDAADVGVKAVANDLTVRIGTGLLRSDSDIAQAVISAFRWSTTVPHDTITVAVSDGWVKLGGKVNWEYQRAAAVRLIRDLAGVKGVTNLIAIEPHINAADVKSKIEAALKRSAEVDARRINVTATDGKVILTGNVHSWFERDEARRAAWNAPGVKQVEDQIAVVP